MITYMLGGLLTSPADTLVNTVNTVGVMGKGVAKEFKAIYPDMFDAYVARCMAGELAPGTLQLWRTPHKNVLNLPTKRHWRNPSRLEDIDTALRTFADTWQLHGLTSVAFPPLGCGNGGLDWESEVRPLMERWLAPLPVRCYIHIPDGNRLRPTGKERKKLEDWLRGMPIHLAWEAFRNELAQLDPGLDRGEDTGLGNDTFALWRMLDSGEAVSAHNEWGRVLKGLRKMPYVTHARALDFIVLPKYDRTPIAELLSRDVADAFRLIPHLIPETHRTQGQQPQRDKPCRVPGEKQTMLPLQSMSIG